MESESKAEARHPDLSMTNVTSWYRSLAQEQEWTDALRDALRDVWPDFRSFKLVDAGLNTKALQLRFENKGSNSASLFFDQLSDGERALIGLYMVRSAMETGAVFAAETEEEVYRHLGYDFIPPELRENAGELEAARRGRLPVLVEVGDLVGDLHGHSTWSADGKATIEEMALAAKARGYRYLAVTDHSHYLRDGRLELQAEEIAELNARLKPFRLLRGIEVNIKADGTLDVTDEVLAGLDWVVASLHTSFDRNPTERILASIDNQHVDCIGHLTGRRLSRREGADVDVELVVERALATKTALEINSQPDRLDLSDTNARLAGEAGVLICVDSDAHSTAALGYVEYGISVARRAWLTKEQVLNTRPWPEIEKMRR